MDSDDIKPHARIHPQSRRLSLATYYALRCSLGLFVLGVFRCVTCIHHPRGPYIDLILLVVPLCLLFVASVVMLFLHMKGMGKKLAAGSIVSLFVAVLCFMGALRGRNMEAISLVGLLGGLVAAWACGLAAVDSWYRGQLVTLPGVCISCGYNLTGNVSGVCPECGTPIEPLAPSS